ncbi:unnamed protein product [Ambrosiozyma monospora]|uniref:Unnamed protein product n=1 Tax=Ambrosiozyma monospora TaxID=43982 RepID=A0ACB5U721_AMBMO|nr:unnamed protein product [Ambrosiozyma monospora]
MSLAYALKYPRNINKLVLVSPGGIERTPLAITNPAYQNLEYDAEKDDPDNPQTLQFKSSFWPGDYGFFGRYPSIKPTFKTIWEFHLSFFTFLRWMAPWGPKALSERNLSKLARTGSVSDWKELDLFIRYLYQTNLKASISETSIMRIFDASVVAKYPMLDRIQDLKVQETLWIYGQHDYMFNDCGRAAVKLLNERWDDSKAEFEIVSNAGHNLYLDNYKEFNEKVLKFLSWNNN